MSAPAASPTRIKPDDQRPEHPDFWCKRFGDGVTPWDAGKTPAALADFAARQPAPLNTLIPGCGSAWEAAHLAGLGWPVTALDFSPAAVDKARTVLGAAAVDMGLAAKPGLDGKGLLVQMCQSCHNPNLDQTISRARFDVTKLATMSREEKEVAISRLRLASTNPAKMPPSRFRTLTDAEIGLVEAELRR